MDHMKTELILRTIGSTRETFLWKGAVEPASTASGNEYKAYKGAMEPRTGA